MLSLALLLLLQEKKEPPKPDPKVLFAVPLGVKPGAPVKVLLRGLSLDGATGVKVGGGAEAKIKSKGKAVVPANQEAGVYGDTQVELELKASTPGELLVEIVTPAGTAPPHRLLVGEAVAEKEPNGGFAQAQTLESGTVVEGAIGGGKDVDVFRIDAKAGERWTFEVTASRLGSPLDPVLVVHDAAGRQLAMSDDRKEGRDPLLTLAPAGAGPLYVTLIDAHDQGGPTHAYRFSLRRE